MNEYRLEHNAATNSMEQLAIDDAWRLANRPDQIVLVSDRTSIPADGTTMAQVSVQLVNPLGQAKTVSRVVQLWLNDEEVALELDENGQGALEITALQPGDLRLQALNPDSNVITLEVTHE